jgi:hypothetical protein
MAEITVPGSPETACRVVVQVPEAAASITPFMSRTA